MEKKLFDSELKIMEVLWKEGDKTARELAEILGRRVGWSKTTTYTVIKKCIEKEAVSRTDPNFLCHALLTREEAQAAQTDELIEKMYGGAADQLVASLLGRRRLNREEIERLKQMVSELE